MAVMYKVAATVAVLFLTAQTGYGQTPPDDSEVPQIDLMVTIDEMDSFFNSDIFFVTNFSITAMPYDPDMAGVELDNGENDSITVPVPFEGVRAAVLDFSGFGVLSIFGVEAAESTINYSISFWYYTNTDFIVLALSTDVLGGVTSEFAQLFQTGGEWVFMEVDLFEVFGDIAWAGFQFRNFVDVNHILFLDEVILSIPAQPNDCNGQVDPSLCPCGPFNVICGTGASDFIGGTNGCDCIYGFGGADTIYGNGGTDWIWGGLGNDVILAGKGADNVYGEGGFDTIYGGDGNDNLYGGAQADVLLGGNGNDKIFGEAGNDKIFGQANADKLFGGEGADTLYSGVGLDVLQGGTGKDILYSEDSQADTLNGGQLFDKAFLSIVGCGKHTYVSVEKVVNSNGKFITCT